MAKADWWARKTGSRLVVCCFGNLARSFSDRHGESKQPSLTLFFCLSGYGGRLNPNYLGNWVHHVIDAAQIGKTGSCHLFHDACATHLHENGADLRSIQEMHGHAHLDTTQIYTQVSIALLRETHARCHPRGQVKPDLPPRGKSAR